MKRYHIIQDDKVIANTATKKAAVELIKSYKEKDTFYFKPCYSVIYGEEVVIVTDKDYEKSWKGQS